jgi:hypothetical protein
MQRVPVDRADIATLVGANNENINDIKLRTKVQRILSPGREEPPSFLIVGSEEAVSQAALLLAYMISACKEMREKSSEV